MAEQGEMGGDCAMPKPTREHEMLSGNVGTWNVKCQYFMDPSQPPMEQTAVETVEPVGAFWTVSKFECDMMGAPFVGRATCGYDTRRGKWVGTWIDSMSTNLFVMEGDMNEEGTTLEMTCQGPNMQTGDMTTFRSVEKRNDDGTREFDFHMALPDGNEIQLFHYVYSKQS